MNKHIHRLAALALAALLLGGCAGAREIVIEKGGGAVAIPSNTPRNRSEALALIAKRCPGGYNIVREEEVVVGTTSSDDTTIDRDLSRSYTVSHDYRVRNHTEWRIQYTCR